MKMNTLCLSHLAEVASNTRPITGNDQPEKVCSEESLEPPAKKVRFEGVKDAIVEDTIPAEVVAAATEGTTMTAAEFEKVMQNVRRRAERRKRRSLRSPPPPPPQPAGDDVGSASSSSQEEHTEESHDDMLVMQRKLESMEQAIKKSARMELQLMNQSKKLRDERALLTRKYESMAEQLRDMQRSQQSATGEPPVLFKMGPLPPLMSVPTRRISTTKTQMSHFMPR